MGSLTLQTYTMIHWLINASFYAPLSFESGVLSGAVTMTISHIAFKVFNFFHPTNSDNSVSFLKTLRKIVSPIREFELFLQDDNYRQLARILVFLCLLLLGLLTMFFVKYIKTKKTAKKNPLVKETKRLLHERSQFISKVDQLEKLNKRYREAVFLAEKSYNEEHKLKRLEEKRLKNLEKYMDQCSKAISNRKERLNSTLKVVNKTR